MMAQTADRSSPREVDVAAPLESQPDVAATSAYIFSGDMKDEKMHRLSARRPTLGHEADMHYFFQYPPRVCVR